MALDFFLPVTDGSASPVRWRSLALPVEHGGWGFVGEPVLLGLALAPSAAGLALAGAAVAGFLVRHPLRLALLDRVKGARHPRTVLAERLALVYSAAALVLVLIAVATAGLAFWPAILLAAPPGVVALAGDARGRSREALPEIAGAIAITAAAPAIALAGGVRPGLAFGAWGLLVLRAATSILYVRARLRRDRALPAGIRSVLVAHVLAVVAAAALAALGWAPRVGVLALGLLLLRAAHGLSARRRPLPPRALGFREVGWGLVLLGLLVVGYRAAL